MRLQPVPPGSKSSAAERLLPTRRSRGQDPPTALRGQGVDRYTRGLQPRVMGAVPIDPSIDHSGVVQRQDARHWTSRRGFDTFLPNDQERRHRDATRRPEAAHGRRRGSCGPRRDPPGEEGASIDGAPRRAVRLRRRRRSRRRSVRHAVTHVPAWPGRTGAGFVTQSIRVRVPGPAPRSCSSVGRARV